MLCSYLQHSVAGKGVCAHLPRGREWPYEEPEKPQHATKPRGAFGQYKKPKGHKHEKAKQQRCTPRFVWHVCVALRLKRRARLR